MSNLEYAIVALLCSAAALYGTAWLLFLFRRPAAGFTVWGLAWLLNAGLFAANWIFCGEPPFGNMYHVLTVLAWCFLPLYGWFSSRAGMKQVHLYFAFAAMFPMIGGLFMPRDIFWSRMPALQSPWFVPHVLAYMISYALAAVAFALTVAGLRRRAATAAPGLDREAAAYEILRLAFPFMTFGMLSGALWAEEAWGVYWSWDPKETWSLITWTLYAIYLHSRRTRTLRPWAAPAQLLAFGALLTTFLLVNLLPKLSSALHSYAAP